MCLIGLVIGVLPHDNDLDVGDGCHFEGIEDILLLGINLLENILTFRPDSYSSFTNL